MKAVGIKLWEKSWKQYKCGLRRWRVHSGEMENEVQTILTATSWGAVRNMWTQHSFRTSTAFKDLSDITQCHKYIEMSWLDIGMLLYTKWRLLWLSMTFVSCFNATPLFCALQSWILQHMQSQNPTPQHPPLSSYQIIHQSPPHTHTSLRWLFGRPSTAQ